MNGMVTQEVVYVVMEWPYHKEILPGQKHVANNPLTDAQKTVLSPPHMGLGLVKKFVKVMNCNGEGFGFD
jgi:hypothetical protein